MDNSQAHCHRWHRSTALDMAENLVTRRSSIADRGCPPARDGAGFANVCPTSNPRHTKEESEEHAITHEETPSDFVAIGIFAVEPPGHGARMGRRLGDQRQRVVPLVNASPVLFGERSGGRRFTTHPASVASVNASAGTMSDALAIVFRKPPRVRSGSRHGWDAPRRHRHRDDHGQLRRDTERTRRRRPSAGSVSDAAG